MGRTGFAWAFVALSDAHLSAGQVREAVNVQGEQR
jgi:hypothetical protein